MTRPQSVGTQRSNSRPDAALHPGVSPLLVSDVSKWVLSALARGERPEDLASFVSYTTGLDPDCLRSDLLALVGVAPGAGGESKVVDTCTSERPEDGSLQRNVCVATSNALITTPAEGSTVPARDAGSGGTGGTVTIASGGQATSAGMASVGSAARSSRSDSAGSTGGGRGRRTREIPTLVPSGDSGLLRQSLAALGAQMEKLSREHLQLRAELAERALAQGNIVVAAHDKATLPGARTLSGSPGRSMRTQSPASVATPRTWPNVLQDVTRGETVVEVQAPTSKRAIVLAASGPCGGSALTAQQSSARPASRILAADSMRGDQTIASSVLATARQAAAAGPRRPIAGVASSGEVARVARGSDSPPSFARRDLQMYFDRASDVESPAAPSAMVSRRLSAPVTARTVTPRRTSTHKASQSSLVSSGGASLSAMSARSSASQRAAVPPPRQASATPPPGYGTAARDSLKPERAVSMPQLGPHSWAPGVQSATERALTRATVATSASHIAEVGAVSAAAVVVASMGDGWSSQRGATGYESSGGHEHIQWALSQLQIQSACSSVSRRATAPARPSRAISATRINPQALLHPAVSQTGLLAHATVWLGQTPMSNAALQPCSPIGFDGSVAVKWPLTARQVFA